MANKAFKFRRIGFGCGLFSILVCAASCVMTATLIAMLVEEGKLSWQTTISEVFPDLKGEILPQYREVIETFFVSPRSLDN